MRPWVRELVRSLRRHATDPGVEPDAVAELAMWSATSDGVLDAIEVDELASVLAQLPGLEGFDASRAHAIVERLAESYRTEEAIAERILELTVHVKSHEARRACYQLAVWSAARDGQFTEEEAGFLETLQEALELDDDEADALLEATIE